MAFYPIYPLCEFSWKVSLDFFSHSSNLMSLIRGLLYRQLWGIILLQVFLFPFVSLYHSKLSKNSYSFILQVQFQQYKNLNLSPIITIIKLPQNIVPIYFILFILITLLLKLMIFDKNEDSLNAWKTQMKIYQKGKRTKKPFGKTISTVSHVTHEQIKTKECAFNPILQVYQKQEDEVRNHVITEERRAKSLVNHLKQTIKYQKNFDIINLKCDQPYTQKNPNRKLAPVRNAYNVINNQKLPEVFFQNRQMRLPIQKQKKLLDNYKKQFNIINNIYNKNHEQRARAQIDKLHHQAFETFAKTHNYDPVYGKFYDESKEEKYQQERKNNEQLHGQKSDKNLPPSYVYREPLIMDYTKPLPQTLKILDDRNANAKKRYQTKYVVLDEYQKRNVEEDDKHEKLIKEHVHFGRILDEKAKQFDIVTNKPYKQSRAEELFGKKPEYPNWEVLIKEASLSTSKKSMIKTGGFA